MDIRTKAKRRAALLDVTFDKFKARLVKSVAESRGVKPETLSGISINPAILYNAAISYFFDLDRAKDFHETSLANEYRQAAFSVKWLVRLRPINDTNADGRFMLANEKFALAVAFGLLRIDPSQVGKSLYAHLLYSLRYRTLDEGALIAIFMAIKPVL